MAFPEEIEQLRQADADAAAAAATARSALLVAWVGHSLTDPASPLHEGEGDPHWHVRSGYDDEDPATVATVFDALDYAARQLDQRADFERDGASGMAGVHLFEEAWEGRQRADKIYNLAENAQVVHKQANLPPWLRAPLYTGDDEAENTARLKLAAQHAVDQINSEGPGGFAIIWCSHTECAPTDEDEAGDV
jgi:hypothetical protein